MQNIDEIEELVKLISKLPGLGSKSAKRIILKLINSRDELMKPMANCLAEVYKNVSRCNSCGTLKSNSIGCNNCDNSCFVEGWSMFPCSIASTNPAPMTSITSIFLAKSSEVL